MQIIEIYRQAIKRTLANLYGVAPDQVEVSWSKDGGNITVRCADKTFTHGTIHDDDDETLEFVAEDEDPVTVRFSAEERRQLERDALDRLNGY